MVEKLNNLALGYASAILSAAIMLLLGIFGLVGVYAGGVAAMQQWHLFFNVDALGIIAGIVEGAVAGFILGYVFAWLYNKFA